MINLIEDYIPSTEEITEEELTSARATIEGFIGTRLPEVDLQSNTPTGDLIVAPASMFLAGIQIAISRLLSDLDLENVENNVIYNCDFVRKYLGNFAVYDTSEIKAHGVVTLLFNSNEQVTLPRGSRFAFTEESANLYMDLPLDEGDLVILPAGTAIPGEGNYMVKRHVDGYTYAVDINVSGTSEESVSPGTLASVDFSEVTLVSVTATTEIATGATLETLSTLATKARHMAYAPSVGSKGGVEALVRNIWSGTKHVSTVIDGDFEQLRGYASGPLMLPVPVMDVYLRTNFEYADRVDNIIVPYDSAAEKFIGPMNLSSIPTVVRDIVNADGSELYDSFILAEYPDAEAPGLLSGFSNYENLYVIIEPKRSDSGSITTPLITIDGEEGSFGVFSVGYVTDPAFGALAAKVEGKDYRPVGVDTRALQGPVAVIDTLDIRYKRRAGVTFKTSQAKKEIAERVNNSTHDRPFGEHDIADSVFYAGGSSISSITYTGDVIWTSADRVLHQGVDISTLDLSAEVFRDIEGTYAASMASKLDTVSFTAPTIEITSIESIRDDVVIDSVVDAPTNTKDTRVYSSNNARMWTEESNITFIPE